MAAGSVRRAANVMTHVSVDAWVSLLHLWRGRLPNSISASCIFYQVYTVRKHSKLESELHNRVNPAHPSAP